MFVSLVTNLGAILAQPWVEAIAFGALLGAVGGALFIGLSHLLGILQARRYKRQALASRLRVKVETLERVIQEIRSKNGDNTVSAVFEDAENLFLLSQLVLPHRDARPVVDFYEKAKQYLEKVGNHHNGPQLSLAGGRTKVLTAPRTSEADYRQVLRAAELALARLRKY